MEFGRALPIHFTTSPRDHWTTGPLEAQLLLLRHRLLGLVWDPDSLAGGLAYGTGTRVRLRLGDPTGASWDSSRVKSPCETSASSVGLTTQSDVRAPLLYDFPLASFKSFNAVEDDDSGLRNKGRVRSLGGSLLGLLLRASNSILRVGCLVPLVLPVCFPARQRLTLLRHSFKKSTLHHGRACERGCDICGLNNNS